MSSLLLSAKSISKTMGSKLLFENLSFGVFSGEKIGLIGPNGAGKSTLLKMMVGLEATDEGEISQRKNLTTSFVGQESRVPENQSLQQAMTQHLQSTTSLDAMEVEVQSAVSLSVVGFENFEQQVSELSGGWRKRLAIAMGIAQEPDLFILDEPTNHMDWEGILWLESWLSSYKGSLVLVSHDRAFLDSSTNRIIEINPLYREGYLSFNCNYRNFLNKKEEYVQSQLKEQESLSNKARREVEWLRAGVKARTTKSQSRIDRAHKMLNDLSGVKARNASVKAKSRLEIESSQRKTKKLIELKKVSLGYENKELVSNLDLVLSPKNTLGLLGHNGSGKTSLLKVINKKIQPISGEVRWAEGLQIIYFDQERESIPQDINLIQYLGDGSDYTLFKDQSIHVASYASRFLFTSEKMHLKISQLSGGEQARLLIAKLLLKPADVLILDEPTNDLDIETIEVLEDALDNFNGLVLLVSHDRYFLSNLCQRFLALDGKGGWTIYADINQWLKQDPKALTTDDIESQETPIKSSSPKKKLSYKDKQRLSVIEKEISEAEHQLETSQKNLEEPDVISDQNLLSEAIKKVTEHQSKVDQLYAEWEELEAKSAGH